MSSISGGSLRLLCGIFLTFATLSCRPASGVVTEVSFAEPASEYAVDPQSGNIAAVDPTNNKVSLYGPDLKSGAAPQPIASLVVGNRPTSVVFKQAGTSRLFAVGCLAESNIYLFDAATLKQIAKIPVKSSDVSSVAASINPEDPYVYYCYGRGHDSACGRVQVLKHVDEGLAFDDAMDCAISASGNYAYRRGPWSPSGFESLRKVEPAAPGGKTTFQRVFYDHNSTAQYHCDPFELYTAAGQNLYTVRLDKSIAKLSFSPLAFFDNHPWMIGIQGQLPGRGSYYSGNKGPELKLVVASTNTFQNIGEFSLPASFTQTKGERENFAGPGQADFKFVGNRLAMIADAKRDRILLFLDKRGLVVPVADLKLPDEPFLVISADTKAPIVVGSKNVIKLATKDSRIKVELLDKPEGLQLTSNGLEFTPNADQIGELPVRFKLSYGSLERTHTVELNVSRSYMQLPFAANRISVSDDGKSLIAWTTPRGDIHRHEQPTGDEAVPRCAVIDPVARNVLTSAALPFTPETAAVDEHYVYAVQQHAGVVSALGRNDLGHRKQVSFDGAVAWLRPIGNKELIVGTTDGRWLKYGVPDLKLIAENRSGILGQNGMASHVENMGARTAMTRIAEGWQFVNGDVFDEGLSKQLLVKGTGTLKNGGAGPQGSQSAFGRRNEEQYGINSSFRTGNTEQAVVGLARVGTAQRFVFLTRSVQSMQVPNAIHTSRTIETWSVLGDPPGTVSSRSTVLSKSSDVTQGGGDAFGRMWLGAMAADKDQVYCSFGGRLYQLPLSDVLAVKPIEESPPRFKPTQSTLVVDLSGTTTLKHQVLDGKPPMQFALTAPFAGTSINPTDGTISIDGAAVAKALLDQMCGAKDPMSPNGFRGQAQLNSESLEAYLLTAANDYEQITGTKPKGVPVALSVGLQATDSNPRTAPLSYYVLADLPRAQVDGRMAEMAAEIAKLREQQLAERTARQVGGGGAGDASPEVQARIRRLEERIMSLEAQIGILTKLLAK